MKKGVGLLDMLKERLREPTPLEMVSRELAQAHLEKLEAETAVDYAQSIVDYNNVRIARLNAHLRTYKNEERAE
jgi:hypothetical protein